jgi:hypothetical protein
VKMVEEIRVHRGLEYTPLGSTAFGLIECPCTLSGILGLLRQRHRYIVECLYLIHRLPIVLANGVMGGRLLLRHRATVETAGFGSKGTPYSVRNTRYRTER